MMMKTQFFSTQICCLSTLLALQILGIQPINAQSITASPDGTGTLLQQSGNQILITGGSRSIDGANLFHSFQQFNVDTGQVANFLANPGIQNILGRVTGGSPSLINGMLQVTGSNANLFLMNPSGMIFGANASLNVPASFTATTANGVQFSNGWWGTETTAAQMTNLLGNPTGFGLNTSGTLLNTGNLTVAEGAQITLLGGTVVNTGTIEAPGGKVTIAAIPSEKLVRITPEGGLLSIDLPMGDRSVLQSTQSGTPASLAELLTGKDSSNAGISMDNGQVTLIQSGEGIKTQSGSVTVSGSISVAANSAKNSAVHILGDQVSVSQATIDASGNQGAGSIKIGGDYQGKGTIPTAKSTTLKNSSISANSNLQGDGGQIIIWSNENTEVQAKLSAKGGTQSGNGGLVETSSAKVLKTAGTTVDASASQGKAGTWLLDPTDLEVVNGPAGANQVSADTIASTLDTGTSVAIDTSSGVGGNGDITFTGNVNQTGSGNAGLSFTGRRIINNGGQINLTSTGGLTFNLNAVNAEAIAPTSSIQAAHDVIGNVNGPTTINLGAGTYAGNTLSLTKNLTLNGSGIGNTLLSGETTRRVVSVAPTGTVTIQNLSIANGFTGNNQSGAGILNNGSLTLNTVELTNNSTSEQGGGIFNQGNLSLDRSILSGNTASNRSGGGIFNEAGANLTVTNSQFISNQARYGGGIATRGNTNIDNSTFRSNTTRNAITADDGVDGGALRVYDNGRLTLTNSLIENNTARFGGGLEASDNAVVSISNSIFRGNEATRSGGGIQNDNLSQMTIDQTTIDSNRVLERGGGGIENKARLTVTNSTLSNNQAITTGGGISQNTPTTPSDPVELSLTNVTISGNQAAMGGGVRVETGTATISSTTIANNTATQSGGGIYVDGGAINVRNTIVATNNSPNAPDVTGTFNDLGNNLIGNNTGSTGFTNSQYVGTAANPINPLIAPLGNYGGNTQTHALLPSSRALDSGNTSAAPATDQRGVSRVNGADIGAFESRGFIITAKDGTPQTTDINTNFAQPIGVTVTSIGGEPVDGGQVTFTAPSNGASTTVSGSTPVTIAGGRASLPVAANSTVGQYQVTATGNGIANPETFDLSNVAPTPIPTPIAPAPTTPTTPAPTPNPPIVTPDASPTEPTPTIQPAQEPIKFVAAKCDADGINDRKKNGNDDWVLRIANRSQVAKLLNAGDITGALQTLDLMTSRKGASGTQINPQMLDTGCPQSNLKDLAQQTRSGLIYTFVQDGYLDVILVSAGGPPVHKRMANISTVELQKLTQTLQQNPTAPTSLAAAQQLYQWLINPLLPELKAQAIDALFFSMDESLKDLPIAKLHDGKQYLESQYAIKAIGDRNTPQQLSQKN